MSKLIAIWPLFLAAAVLVGAISALELFSAPDPQPAPVSNRVKKLADSELGFFLSMLLPAALVLIPMAGYFAVGPLARLVAPLAAPFVSSDYVRIAVIVAVVNLCGAAWVRVGRFYSDFERAVAQNRE